MNQRRSVHAITLALIAAITTATVTVRAFAREREAIHIQTATGIVKWFNSEKGFGFITPVSGGPDMFAHQSQLDRMPRHTLKENQIVDYDIAIGPKGPQANNIRIH